MDRIRVILMVSIILNLFLAAALVAGFVSLRTDERMIRAGSLRIAGSELPVDERTRFRAALHEARWGMHGAVAASVAAKTQAAALLRAPMVDQPAVLRALDQARNADVVVRAAVEQRAVAFAATLPQADRAKLADAMLRRAPAAKGN